MKQGNFIVEFVQIEKSVMYIVRATNGQVVRVCHDVSILCDFFNETESKILSTDSHEAS